MKYSHLNRYWFWSLSGILVLKKLLVLRVRFLQIFFDWVFFFLSSAEEKIGAMSNLWLRILPPQVLLEWPKEASFCLWLLHPQPNTRPKMSDLLQSEFLDQPRDSLEDREAAIKLREEIREQELLLEFLLQMQEIKQETANKLHDTICFLSSDIDEIRKQQPILNKKGSSFSQSKKDKNTVIDNVGIEDSTILCSQKRLTTAPWIHTEEEFNPGGQWSEFQSDSPESIQSKSSRVMKNLKKLESTYLSTRCQPITPALKPMHRNSEDSSIGKGSVVQTEGSSVDNFASKAGHVEGRKGAWIDSFLDGLCKYLSFSKLKVRADLNQGDLLKSSNLVRSLSFDRDKEFFAAAGLNRKIKVFDCDAILNEDQDIHYPVAEMGGRSTISSVCWNGYIKSQIASSNFDGVVQIWDVTSHQVFVEMREHERRVWSVDFSHGDPTNLASGSDDGVVKLWNINQRGSIATIKIKANVCSVQFPPGSARYLAIGSADHKFYYYDLRNTRIPWCTFIGHTKTVSNVRFVDSTNLVSASTDNSLKLWDLTMSASRVVDNPIRTFTGHTNVKNFVGLSISDGYIATGSETNEVIVYHKAFPMPALSYKFDGSDRLTGHEVDGVAQFISCVCWRGQSSILVAANSTGNIKLLEMV
ncbi:protein SPA1-RELATED 3 isoform X3 [Magnolia sinica]|uniref:protein SPA1-RELATED 3 isoform X3 n=1 Tax=Magnolia sinica TaxID=86752 RepID=UPI00265B4AC0|nr:protein SPA1-RELATED 3 isoform X3 [Magnolia sinica]